MAKVSVLLSKFPYSKRDNPGGDCYWLGDGSKECLKNEKQIP